MHLSVDIPFAYLARLDALSEARRGSRAALIREAIAQFLATHAPLEAESAFGLWAFAEDGLAYQRCLREE